MNEKKKKQKKSREITGGCGALSSDRFIQRIVIIDFDQILLTCLPFPLAQPDPFPASICLKAFRTEIKVKFYIVAVVFFRYPLATCEKKEGREKRKKNFPSSIGMDDALSRNKSEEKREETTTSLHPRHSPPEFFRPFSDYFKAWTRLYFDRTFCLRAPYTSDVTKRRTLNYEYEINSQHKNKLDDDTHVDILCWCIRWNVVYMDKVEHCYVLSDNRVILSVVVILIIYLTLWVVWSAVVKLSCII